MLPHNWPERVPTDNIVNSGHLEPTTQSRQPFGLQILATLGLPALTLRAFTACEPKLTRSLWRYDMRVIICPEQHICPDYHNGHHIRDNYNRTHFTCHRFTDGTCPQTGHSCNIDKIKRIKENL